MNQEFVKINRFDGTNFYRWKNKMMFLLSVLSLAHVLDPNTTSIPNAAEDASKEEKERVVKLKKSVVRILLHAEITFSILHQTNFVIFTCQFNRHWRFRNLWKRNTIMSDKVWINLSC